MPELKRTFTGGKMNKDLDERILPNGQYREALNIGVATSEDSDVGAAQNILGNIKVTSAISSVTYQPGGGGFGNEHVNYNHHIAEIVDPQTDMLYRFVHTPNDNHGVWMDRVIEYDTSKGLKVPWEQKEHAIMIDVFRVVTPLLEHDCVCLGSNKAKIRVGLSHVNFLRWGMLVHFGAYADFAINDGVTVEHIDYITGWITLSQPVFTDTSTLPSICPDYSTMPTGDLTFIGDRNLNFSTDNPITGINIIDGMIFWTDNFSEPKKINIRRGKIGSISEYSRQFDGIFGANIGRLNQSKIADFNQPTLLFVADEWREDCMKDESFCALEGCTDPTAVNYNPLAVLDNGDCCYIEGCMDGSLQMDANGLVDGQVGYIDTYWCNYDVDACVQLSTVCGSCGCTDNDATNFDPLATIDDGSCIYAVTGCTDPDANNYDPLATVDDGSCTYDYECVTSPHGYMDGANDMSLAGVVLNGDIASTDIGGGAYVGLILKSDPTYDTGLGGLSVVSGSTQAYDMFLPANHFSLDSRYAYIESEMNFVGGVPQGTPGWVDSANSGHPFKNVTTFPGRGLSSFGTSASMPLELLEWFRTVDPNRIMVQSAWLQTDQRNPVANGYNPLTETWLSDGSSLTASTGNANSINHSNWWENPGSVYNPTTPTDYRMDGVCNYTDVDIPYGPPVGKLIKMKIDNMKVSDLTFIPVPGDTIGSSETVLYNTDPNISLSQPVPVSGTMFLNTFGGPTGTFSTYNEWMDLFMNQTVYNGTYQAYDRDPLIHGFLPAFVVTIPLIDITTTCAQMNEILSNQYYIPGMGGGAGFPYLQSTNNRTSTGITRWSLAPITSCTEWEPEVSACLQMIGGSFTGANALADCNSSGCTI